MKTQQLRFLIIGLFLALPLFVQAQMGFNSPAGITPKQDVEMYSRNNFLWQQKYRVTTDAISTALIMNCSPTTVTATAGILISPGGPGNLPSNINCTQTIGSATFSSTIGYELSVDYFSVFPGDSVIIEDENGGRMNFTGTPSTLIIPGYRIKITVKTVSHPIPVLGFQVRWRRLFLDTEPPLMANAVFGNLLRFDAAKGSLVAGLHGVGTATQAGIGAVVLGKSNSATGDYAVSMGFNNTAREDNTVTMGAYNSASKFGAVAMGGSNVSAGFYSLAMGYDNIASGNYSTALGSEASTNGYAGAFVIGDASTFTSTSATVANQFSARFAGGYRLFTNSASTIGVQLAAGGNAWSAISDSSKKERFLPLNHTDLLAKLRTLRLGTWNYKGQRTERHYGPMAQDFFARFGHDALGVIGCDTLLNSHDFTAVTLSGVQALALENEQLKAKLAQAESRLEALERAVFLRSAPRTSSRLRRKQERP